MFGYLENQFTKNKINTFKKGARWRMQRSPFLDPCAVHCGFVNQLSNPQSPISRLKKEVKGNVVVDRLSC